MQLPAATSWLSAIARETNANATAAINDADAIVFSSARVIVILFEFYEPLPLMGGRGGESLIRLRIEFKCCATDNLYIWTIH